MSPGILNERGHEGVWGMSGKERKELYSIEQFLTVQLKTHLDLSELNLFAAKIRQ